MVCCLMPIALCRLPLLALQPLGMQAALCLCVDSEDR